MNEGDFKNEIIELLYLKSSVHKKLLELRDPIQVRIDLGLEFESTSLPFLSVYGGKITTYRLLAEQAVDKLCAQLKVSSSSNTSKVKLPGADFISLQSLAKSLNDLYPWLPLDTRERWLHSYGSLSLKILAGATAVGDLGEDFGNGLYQREVDYLVSDEWANTAEDILWRRTKLGLKFKLDEIDKLSSYLSDKLT